MESLRKIIAAFRREIEAGITQDIGPGRGVRLELDRVVATLHLSIGTERTGNGVEEIVVRAAAVGSGGAEPRERAQHTITLEFKLSGVGRAIPARADRQGECAEQLDGREADEVSSALASLFGPPGFDSSARATVFREALSGMVHDRARAIVDSLFATTSPEISEGEKRARHLISRVLTSGPLKSANRGGEVLASILDRYTLESVLRLVDERWKSQDEWIT